jgi:hypothetical protein
MLCHVIPSECEGPLTGEFTSLSTLRNPSFEREILRSAQDDTL